MGDRQGIEPETSQSGGTQESEPAQAGADHEGSSSTRFSSAGAIPSVLGFPGGARAPSASDRAFGLANPDDMKARADRMDAERLLTSESVTSWQEAAAAFDLLLGVADGQRGKVIDQLGDKAFSNLLDRLPDDQRVRFAGLVESSTNPKRKVLLWAAQHKARARTDLRRYEGDFGDPKSDERTEEQTAAQDSYDRRKAGVEATDAEVARECAALMAKGDKLTVADVDAMRARRDLELTVETEHNVNLVAETQTREDGSQVAWSTGELGQVDAALDKLPDNHVHDHNSVSTYTRRANRHFTDTKGGEYSGGQISIYDAANNVMPGREHMAPVEYTMTHEIGHEVETENKKAFSKFEHAAGWTTTTEAEIQKRGGTDEDLDGMHKPTQVGDKVYKRGGKGAYNQVDETAIPSESEAGTERWNYARNSSQEHFAEVYAMAVQAPAQLHTDYVTKPAEATRPICQRDVRHRPPRVYR